MTFSFNVSNCTFFFFFASEEFIDIEEWLRVELPELGRVPRVGAHKLLIFIM
jgi:hypothetical protein